MSRLIRMGKDYSTAPRQLLLLSGLAVPVGLMGGLVAFVLLRLIGLITHLAYLGQWNTALTTPNPRPLGLWSIGIPVAGGLLVGLLARYGTDKIRGHGIPEAIQAILAEDSRMPPKVAIIKPLASAITIGTGGPFGAEGPIIMTGGALGSLLGQLLPVTALERRTLLVAGAAAGMSATFGAPISSVLLAVELLLFEFRPRSMVPVAVASVVAYGVRILLIGSAPIFGGPLLSALPWAWLGGALVVGLAAGGLSGLLTRLVYAVEDLYGRLPIHWMWWPALGGLAVGLGGLAVPAALGVGYPVIRSLDAGHVLLGVALALMVVKLTIWVLSLSSGTSGGVLAPLLLIGGALGTVLAPWLPGPTAVWATLGMAAMLGGTMRAPFTATLFAMETTHQWALILPTLVASLAGMVVTVLFVPRSILTEKVARRGLHVAREYSVHPLEADAVRAIMTPRELLITLQADWTLAEARTYLRGLAEVPDQEWFPVIGEEDRPPVALCAASHLWALSCTGDPNVGVRIVSTIAPLIAEEERVRAAVSVMARSGIPAVIAVGQTGIWSGLLCQRDTLKTWRRALAAEEDRLITWHPWRRRSLSSHGRTESIDFARSRESMGAP